MPAAERIFALTEPDDFATLAMEVFHWQVEANPVYREFVGGLGVNPQKIHEVDEIPFLPVEFFKTRRVLCGRREPALVFESSGTTTSRPARHFVIEPGIYEQSFFRGFQRFYGDVRQYCILALLPSYLEHGQSSLAYMADALIRASEHGDSGFYLDGYDQLSAVLHRLESKGQPVILLGVSFALLEFGRRYPQALTHTTVMETGGMKGRLPEMTREELHGELQEAFGVRRVHSEYGMTELLSQAWSQGHGIFQTPPWVKVRIRDPYDPLSAQRPGRSGGIDIIDLANLWSCAFLSVQDIGRLHPEGGFEVLGRFDHSDIRGCNLMLE